MIWAHTCTNLAAKPPEQSWLVPRQLWAGQEEHVSPSHLQQCPGEPTARGAGVQGRRRRGGLAGTKQSSMLHPAGEPERGTGWEMHPGRGSEEEQATLWRRNSGSL